MPHKFIVGREIAPLLVKVRRLWYGGVRYGLACRSRSEKVWCVLVRLGRSRRSGSGAVWLGTVRLVKAVGVGCGVVRFGTVGQGGLGLVR